MAGAQTEGHLSFLQAAEQVLRQAKTPLKPEEIVKWALSERLIATTGKTPVASMGSRLYSEIKRQGDASTFVKDGKAQFGLREWRIKPPAPVVPIVADPVERLAAEVMTAQYESYSSIRFEKVLTEAFAMLGFDARHVGGAGRTDILLDASVSAASYRVVVDAKSNKHGKIGD